MSARVYFSVLSLAVATIDRLIKRIVPLAKTYLLPWLIGTFLLILWSLFWYVNLRHVLPAHWFTTHELIINLIWAPFFALITIAVLRANLRQAKFNFSDNFRCNVRLIQGPSTWLVIAIYIALFLSYAAVETSFKTGSVALISWLAPNGTAPLLETAIPLWYRLYVICGAWLPYALVNLIFFTAIAVAVYEKHIGLKHMPKRIIELIRLSPRRIIGFLLVISAADIGFNMIYERVYHLAGAANPQYGTYFLWQDYALASVKYQLVDLPRLFLTSMLQLLALRAIYHVLTKTNDELTRRVDLARNKKL